MDVSSIALGDSLNQRQYRQ